MRELIRMPSDHSQANKVIARRYRSCAVGLAPDQAWGPDVMTSDGDRIVGEIIKAMLKEGRRAEVDEIIVQTRVWEQDNRALGPDLARFTLEVDRMRSEERATNRQS